MRRPGLRFVGSVGVIGLIVGVQLLGTAATIQSSVDQSRKMKSKTESLRLSHMDPHYGVSFEFPRGYELKTGKAATPDLGYLGDATLNFDQPGGVIIASVQLPKNSFPGTDFNHAFFSVSVNVSVSASGCSQFARSDALRPGVEPKVRLKTKAGTMELVHTETFGAAMHHQLAERSYHIFRNMACYEFGLGLATSGYGVVDGMTRVDSEVVFRKLDEILSTVVIRRVAISRKRSGAPSPF